MPTISSDMLPELSTTRMMSTISRTRVAAASATPQSPAGAGGGSGNVTTVPVGMGDGLPLGVPVLPPVDALEAEPPEFPSPVAYAAEHPHATLQKRNVVQDL